MARREYLSPEERARFDAPPTLTVHQRPILLDLPAWAEACLQTMQTPINRVGFLLQLGYFRISTRFFAADHFEPDLVDWVAFQLRIDPNGVDMTEYARSRSSYRHREDILHHLGYSAFGSDHQRAIAEEAHRLAHLQTRPALILDALAGYLREKRVEIPPYSSLRSVLTEALDGYQTRLEELIESYLSVEDRAALDVLLAKQSPATGSVSSLLWYRLTFLKRISQSMQPKAIRQRVDLFTELKALDLLHLTGDSF